MYKKYKLNLFVKKKILNYILKKKYLFNIFIKCNLLLNKKYKYI